MKLRKKIALKILKEDFEQSRYDSTDDDAVCKAFKRRFKNVTWISAGASSISFTIDKEKIQMQKYKIVNGSDMEVLYLHSNNARNITISYELEDG